MKITVLEYIRENGANPYKAWFDSLDAHAAAKVATAKVRLELGNTSGVKWLSAIGEYRIDWGPGYRIYTRQGRGRAYRPVRRRDEEAAAVGYQEG